MRSFAPRTLLAAAATVAAFGIGVGASAPGSARAAEPCWQRLIADWADNGSIDGAYSPGCYRAAIANAPTDLQIYSNLEDDLQRALQARNARRIAVDATRATTVHHAELSDSSSTSPVVVALGAGLGLIAAAVSTALVLGHRRR